MGENMAPTNIRTIGIAAIVIAIVVIGAVFLLKGEETTTTPTPTTSEATSKPTTKPTTPTASPSATPTTLATAIQPMQTTTGTGLAGEIPIGLAISVSGGYAVDGPRRLKGALLAIEEVNQLLEAINAPFRFKPVHEDTKTDPQEAVNVIKRFASSGIKVVIGPLSTSCTRAVMPIANEQKIVIISPSSTGSAAAFPDDYVFRMPPPDTVQGPALAKIIHGLGFTKLVIIARNDDYGAGLAKLVEDTFKGLGGKVETILYQPDKPDLSNEVNQLAVKVQQMGADEKTAILIIAFDDDGIKILEQASKIDVLSKVRWFGPDSMARKTFLEKPNIAAFLEKVEFLATKPAIARNPITEHFEKLYREKYGEDPTPYAYYAYDAAWVAMLSIMFAGKYDGEAVKEVLPTVAAHFMGATGHKMLNENGDAAFADYSLVAVKNGQYVEVGIWHSSTGQIEWRTS